MENWTFNLLNLIDFWTFSGHFGTKVARSSNHNWEDSLHLSIPEITSGVYCSYCMAYFSFFLCTDIQHSQLRHWYRHRNCILDCCHLFWHIPEYFSVPSQGLAVAPMIFFSHGISRGVLLHNLHRFIIERVYETKEFGPGWTKIRDTNNHLELTQNQSQPRNSTGFSHLKEFIVNWGNRILGYFMIQHCSYITRD